MANDGFSEHRLRPKTVAAARGVRRPTAQNTFSRPAWSFETATTKLPAVAVFFLAAAALSAQITTVGNDTATPIAGAGHDYRGMLSEIVSPANGSISIRIATPAPKGRGISLPFSFNYDSAGINHLTIENGFGNWISGGNGWSYGLPSLASNFLGISYDKGDGSSCIGTDDFLFTDLAGERHSFTRLTWFGSDYDSCPNLNVTSDQDDRYLAQITNSNGDVAIAGHDGTVYTFPGAPGFSLPSVIEDRNGNQVSIASTANGGFTVVDATGRSVISSSVSQYGYVTPGQISNVSISGLQPYQVTWGSAPFNFYMGSQAVVTNNGGCSIAGAQGTKTVIKTITLPDGQSYQFNYDTTYGLVNKITYPNGAYTRYVWNVDSLSDQIQWAGPNARYCVYRYDEPAIQNRYTSFDGTNEVLEEDYSYSTQWSSSGDWSSKTTTVTTTNRYVSSGNLQTLGAFKTVYQYSPVLAPGPNRWDGASAALSVAVEQTVSYYGYDASLLRTVQKQWQDQYLLASETVTENDAGATANSHSTSYTYDPSTFEITSQSSYDFGGALLRKVSTSYQSFPATPIFPSRPSILDRPCQSIIYDSSGNNRAAETDYYYDGGTALCTAAVATSLPSVSGITGHDETNYGSTSTAPRGNLTQTSVQNLQGNNASTSTYTFDESGQVLSATDPRNYTTQYSWLDNYASGFGAPTGQSNAYLTQVTRPATNGVQHIQGFAYRYSDSQLSSTTDENSQQTTYSYNDSLGRPTETDYPDGGKTTTAYNDSGSAPTITSSTALDGSTNMTRVTIMDGAGHPTQSQLTSDPSGTVYTDTVYDGLGRVYTSSNPYRSSSDMTYGLTAYAYDSLGRILSVTTPDGAVSTTAYAGAVTTSTDPANRSRSTQVDALGRITRVVEDPSGLNYSTTYSYDALDDLLSVNQSGLIRTFAYDSMKRLLAASNPEQSSPQAPAAVSCAVAPTSQRWTMCYSYDLNGNLSEKQDNRTETVTYSYDPLNRMTGKQYSSVNGASITSSVVYCYDGAQPSGCPAVGSPSNAVGRLTSVSNGTSQTKYTNFDPMGRVQAHTQVTGSNSYAFSYQYNLAGSLTSETYPSGRTVTTSYDAANRPIGLAGSLNSQSTNYVHAITYWPHGAVKQQGYGNNVWRDLGYLTAQLQPAGYWDTINEDPNRFLRLEYPHWGITNDNGTLQSTQVYAGAPAQWPTLPNATQTFQYDGVNRLISASEGSSWSQSYSYDAYGNMWMPGNNLTPPSFGPVAPTANVYANNQNQNSTYDGAGNLSALGTMPLTYDAENRQTAAGPNVYGYDGSGQRVARTTSSGQTVYVYDAFGQLAAEYSTVAVNPPCTTCYLSYDYLGSVRMVTDQNANVIARHDYAPFGQEIPGGVGPRTSLWGASDNVNQRFTGKERDSESGLDYFGARYYGSALGRFTSPDDGSDQHPSDPQSWNLYGYVRNNPLAFVDPDGNYVCGSSVSTEQCSQFQGVLDQAQAAANQVKDQYGADSAQYQDAQRAIDAYGKQGVDNGVQINIGATAGYPGFTTADNSHAKTDLDPTGQNIQVTLNSGLLGNTDQNAQNAAIWTVAHEGSHVGDAEDWAKAGFTDAASPTNMATEFRAYGVTESIAGALGAPALSGRAPAWMGAIPPTTFWRPQYLQPVNDALTRLMIKRNYPNWAQQAFKANTAGGGKQ
jgi:RHS repeat-associated protein